MTVAARAAEKDCVLRVDSQQLSTSLSTTTLNKSFTYSLNLLSQPPSRHALWNTKNTDHRLNQCSIDNISIISYIQKTYNTIFNKDC